jgi:NitT/TauT family transport system ATP-binding protein
MQQRAVVARALACEPAVLLFDEPFGSLDAMNRSALEDKLLALWPELGQTILFVTHDVDEAIYLSDRILVFDGPPARIVADIIVELPRPRDQVETRSSPAFAALRKRVHHILAGAT